MVPVTWAVAVGETSWAPPAIAAVPGRIWVLTVVCAMVLLGSTLHVKSLVREWRDPRYARASKAVGAVSAALSPVLAAWWGLPLGLWLVPPFVALLYRSLVVGRRPLRAGLIGMIELACLALVLLGAALAAT